MADAFDIAAARELVGRIPEGVTPGPWAQSHRRKDNCMWSTEVYVADEPENHVATVAWCPAPPVRNDDGSSSVVSRREPTAALIALAPDLATTLTAAIAEIERLRARRIGRPPGSVGRARKNGPAPSDVRVCCADCEKVRFICPSAVPEVYRCQSCARKRRHVESRMAAQ